MAADGPSAILNLLCACLDNQRRVFGGIYYCAKFGWNRCSSFDNMQVLIFNEFGLKMPIHAPNGGFYGDFTPEMGSVTSRPHKVSPCTEARHMTYRSLRSVHSFLHSSPFYPIPRKPYMLCNWPCRHSPKSSASRWGICTPIYNTRFLRSTGLSIQKASRSVEPFLQDSRQSVPILYSGCGEASVVNTGTDRSMTCSLSHYIMAMVSALHWRLCQAVDRRATGATNSGALMQVRSELGAADDAAQTTTSLHTTCV